MKYRSDFVTNSSSSSFVVAFETRPKSVEEVKRLLFGDVDNIDYIFNYENNKKSFSTLDMATIVFNDIKTQKANNIKEISNAFKGNLDGSPNYDDFKLPTKTEQGYTDYDWKEYQKACDKFQNEKTKEFLNKFKNFKIYCFEYSDNDGSLMSHMEHGDIFNNLNHIRISNH